VQLARRKGIAAVSAVHQFVPMLHRSDAVGRHTLRLRDLLVARGVESRIYVELVDPDTEAETNLYREYADDARKGDVLVYQYATASGIAPWLTQRRETLVVNSHNVTPPEYYAAWDNPLARHQLQAQIQLRELAPRAALGIAVSAFNDSELRAAGFARTAVVPPAAMMPAGDLAHEARRGAVATESASASASAAAAASAREGARWLMVGRMAPNKGIELALNALLVARVHHDPATTLEVVGRTVVSSYTGALHRYVDELGLRGAVKFRGSVSDADLAACLAQADVLLVASQHEGFGVPVLEAMSARVPVVANRAGALPDVVGDGGVLVDARNPYEVASAVARVLADDALRGALVEAGAQQVAALDLGAAGDRAVDLITAVRG
jgi:glycosyltransferase involved in cell wall biosynthesis